MTPTQQLVKWQSHNLIPGLSDSKTFSLHIVLLDGNHLPGRNDRSEVKGELADLW